MTRQQHLFPPPSRPARDAGVALIFALAVLALLLVLLIAFLASSILEHRIAYNQSSQVASRLAVRSAMTRVLFQLKNYGDDLAWFRTEDNADNKVIAPLVSCDGALSSAKTKPGDDTSAMPALKPLLEYYLTVKNYFPHADASGTEDYYPQWVALTANGRLTGRYAYVILPNLGIAPAVMGTGTGAAAPERAGGADFKELPLTGLGFLKDAGITRVTSMENWLSFELMVGGKGIYNDNSFYDTATVKSEFDTATVENRELANLYFTPHVWKFNEKRPDSKFRPHLGDDRLNLKEKQFSASDLSTLTGTDGLFGDFADAVREQVAANLIDYTDSDSVPTSDVPPADWKTSAAHPKYTGNELTPYINQVVPMVQANAVYTVPQVAEPVAPETRYTVTREVKVTYCGDLLVELVNIYPKDFSEGGSVFIKELRISGKITLAEGSGGGTTTTLQESTFTLEGDFTTKDFTTIGERTYAVMSLPDNASIRTFKTLWSHSNTDYYADLSALPKWYVTATVDSVKFDRAVLTWNGANVDYVQGRTETPSDRIFINQTDADCFQSASTTGLTTETRIGSAYLSFEAVDPRCNLKGDDDYWKFKTAMVDKEELQTAHVPNYQARNSESDAKNTDPAKEQDLEPNEDPIYLSTAYIRNAAMLSPWELALIHRGTPWQTVNLKSALSPLNADYDSKKGTYLNDAILLERIRFSPEATPDTFCKFNLNLPAQHESAFGVLTKGLHYHNPGEATTPLVGSVTPTALTVAGAGTTALADDAARELAQWIADKCYDAGGTNPAANTAKRYQRYIHRGMLANVIVDWALNGAKSPFKGKALKEAHLSELAGKIVPLTRCGDTYEYFTVFAVGQSIKDFGGGNKFYKYDSNGKLTGTPQNATFGTFDKDIDQITAQTYLVARIRREIVSCEGADSCKLGLHDPKCTFRVVVLESYTLDEL